MFVTMLRKIPYNADFLRHAESQIQADRLENFKKVLENRTRYLTMVSEKSIDYQNVSAMIRTCECLGLQEFHVMEADTTMKMSRFISKGSNKWIDEIRHIYPDNHASATFPKLRQRGYKIAVTSIQHQSYTPHDIPIDQPLAIVLGTEHAGISSEAVAQADYSIHIPMHGFTESFNLSVANAILAHTVLQRIQQDPHIQWRLADQDKQEIYYRWVLASVRHIELQWKNFQHESR